MAERFWIINDAGDKQYPPDNRAQFTSAHASAAFWVILEKFGLPDFKTASLSQWLDRDPTKPAIAIVTSLASGALQPRDIDMIVKDGGFMFLEGPWPSHMNERLGVDVDRSPLGEHETRKAKIRIHHSDLKHTLNQALGGMKGPSNSGAYIDETSLQIRARDRAPRRLSDHVSKHSAAGMLAENPFWRLRATSPVAAPQAAACQHILSWTESADATREHLLLTRWENMLCASMEILAYLMEDYAVPYFHNAYEFSYDRYPLEFAIISIFRQMLQESAAASFIHDTEFAALGATLRLSPWPRGAQYALTIRHDVDRLPRKSQQKKLVEAERKCSAGVSAYFLKQTCNQQYIRRLEDAGVEIAYHAAHLEPDGPVESATIEKKSRRPIMGMTVHGNEGFYGWRGIANWNIAEELGHLYTENLSSTRYLPSRVIKLTEEAGATMLNPIALPHHVSFDAGMTRHYAQEVRNAAVALARNESHLIILNHPDINIKPLCDLISGQLPNNAFPMTAADAAIWWRQTHIAENLRFLITRQSTTGLELSLSTRTPVFGLTLEFSAAAKIKNVSINGEAIDLDRALTRHTCALTPKGARIVLPHIPAGENIIVLSTEGKMPKAKDPIATQKDIDNILRKEMTAWYEAKNGRAATPAQLNSIIHNVEMAPVRRDELLGDEVIKSSAGAPKTILDVGCGFGGLGLAFKAAYPDAAVYLTDLSPRFFSVAQTVVEQAGLRDVFFDCQDIRELPYQNAFDLVILSGMLNFLTSKDDLRRACLSAWKTTAPGGFILIHTPHKWTFREPFTKLPMLQYLPSSAQTRIATALKRRSTMEDIRLPGAVEIRKIFAGLGARYIETTPNSFWRRARVSHIIMRIQKNELNSLGAEV